MVTSSMIVEIPNKLSPCCIWKFKTWRSRHWLLKYSLKYASTETADAHVIVRWSGWALELIYRRINIIQTNIYLIQLDDIGDSFRGQIYPSSWPPKTIILTSRCVKNSQDKHESCKLRQMLPVWMGCCSEIPQISPWKQCHCTNRPGGWESTTDI